MDWFVRWILWLFGLFLLFDEFNFLILLRFKHATLAPNLWTLMCYMRSCMSGRMTQVSILIIELNFHGLCGMGKNGKQMWLSPWTCNLFVPLHFFLQLDYFNKTKKKKSQKSREKRKANIYRNLVSRLTEAYQTSRFNMSLK